MDKSKQIWYLWKTDVKSLTTECYKILQELYIQLGQKPESEMVVLQTNTLVEDLASNYSRMELEEVKFALNKGLRDNDPPIFINVPTWNKFLRDYKKSEMYRRQCNAVEEYTIYKKRMESFGKVLKAREVKKIKNG
tara:strand:+ start:449 stop:856 length:408 start_codon:yes stop_codon:yes gene_type:complete